MPKKFMALDYGEKRIGVAMADSQVKIPIPWGVVENQGAEAVLVEILELAVRHQIDQIVVGLPRNQQGEETAQSQLARQFAQSLVAAEQEVFLQDESLTSVLAEERLQQFGKPYTKADIDAQAAAIILQDYLTGKYQL